MISKDTKVLDRINAVYTRTIGYGTLFDELHIVVLGKSPKVLTAISYKNIFFYNTTSAIKIFSFVKTLGTSLKIAFKIKKFDSWIVSQDPFESGIIAFVVSKIAGIKLQFQLHTDCFNEMYKRHSIKNRLRVFLARPLIPFSNSIRVVSERIKSSLQALNPKLKTSNIYVLPIFVDIKLIAGRPPSFDLRKRYPQFQKIVIVVARLEKEKNILLALKAFKKILRNIPRTGLVIFGTGSEENQLKRSATHLNIQEQVRFLGWTDDPASAYKSSDLLLATSFFEGYGMNVVEALACGCAVVSTDVGIAREAGGTITAFDPGDIALKSIDILKKSIKGNLAPSFASMSKQEYLQKFKETFLPAKNL